MARGHRLNTSIVLAAVHGLTGLFRAVSAVEPSLFRPPTPPPNLLSPSVPNKHDTRFCGRKAICKKNHDRKSAVSLLERGEQRYIKAINSLSMTLRLSLVYPSFFYLPFSSASFSSLFVFVCSKSYRCASVFFFFVCLVLSAVNHTHPPCVSVFFFFVFVCSKS